MATKTTKNPNLFKVTDPNRGVTFVNLAYLRKVEQVRLIGDKKIYPSLVFAKFEVTVVRAEEIRELAKFLRTTPEELTRAAR